MDSILFWLISKKNVLLEIAEKIKSKLKSDGIVILSGLLETDKDAIEKKYHSIGFKTKFIDTKDEWIALVFSSVRE